MLDPRGKVAVVTGASAGLGRRLALDLASAGAVVVGVARREERLQALVDEMRRHSPESSYRVCDLSDAASFLGLLERLEEEHGRIDILANIAGVGGIMRSEPTTAASLRSIMEVNFIAPVAGMVTVLPGMRERRFGAIANMGSDDGRAPGPGAADYSASKAALSAATESLSYDARPDGVFLHTVYPGWVPTDMGLTAVRDGGLSMPPRVAVVPRSKSRRLYSAGCLTRGWRSMWLYCPSLHRSCGQWPPAPISGCGPPAEQWGSAPSFPLIAKVLRRTVAYTVMIAGRSKRSEPKRSKQAVVAKPHPGHISGSTLCNWQLGMPAHCAVTAEVIALLPTIDGHR